MGGDRSGAMTEPGTPRTLVPVRNLGRRLFSHSSHEWPELRHADLLLAVVVAAVQVAGTYAAAQHQPDRRGLDLLGVLLLSAGPLALVARRRHPVAVLGVAFATTLAYVLADYPADRSGSP
jgi:hypothetical protein